MKKASIEIRISRIKHFLRNAQNSRSPFRFGMIELLKDTLRRLEEEQAMMQVNCPKCGKQIQPHTDCPDCLRIEADATT